MTMKKTIAAILLIAMIAVAIALPSFAADTVYFTSVNNILMQLNDDTMAINYDGVMYIPYTVFNSHELGTFAVYSQSAQIVTVFGNGVQLYFNLQDGTIYDMYDTKYRQRAISSNGRIYLPIALTCDYFDINYSVISGNKYGTIIRLTVGSALDDAAFSSAASALMKSRLDDYNKTKATPTPSPTPTPVRTPTPSVSGSEDHSDVSVYLSFWGIDEDNTPRILTMLQTRANPAAFFVTPLEIAAHPDIIRRISGSGHTIGIICGSEPDEDYKYGASLLYDAAQTCTFIIAESADSVNFNTPTDELGLILYASESDAETLNITQATKEIQKAKSSIHIMLKTDYDTVDSLPILLRLLRNDNYNISRLNEQQAAEYKVTE